MLFRVAWLGYTSYSVVRGAFARSGKQPRLVRFDSLSRVLLVLFRVHNPRRPGVRKSLVHVALVHWSPLESIPCHHCKLRIVHACVVIGVHSICDLDVCFYGVPLLLDNCPMICVATKMYLLFMLVDIRYAPSSPEVTMPHRHVKSMLIENKPGCFCLSPEARDQKVTHPRCSDPQVAIAAFVR